MSAAEQFWVVIFLALVTVLIAGHFIDRRRKRSIEEFEQKRRERKTEVERAARKAL
ncbi:hypothetical protein QIT80_gp52 (endogenous virus) [Pseudomonas phage phiAH14a]|uniref:Uncharacterized protein n=1 Tax=Pseudomonas phage phiAH14a TaxID=1805958 RepID=A0A1B0VMF9_9CAUD|nr:MULTISPECIES: hypothetical protein [unclassified Pseudomonas]YP_010773069.1 hypothetical protein QIT80_gp52 [Pseudomonas phage phiAH14a]AMW64512.1 hypothetical protein AH14a_p52 [Pseudomonas phage phiAH14a]